MTDLDTRVRQAFDNVTVPDDVKRGTLTYIASIAEASGVSAETAPASAAAPRKHARARIIPLRRAAAALAACLALAFAGFGGFAYAQPTTYVGIDVNPSIELGVNRFGIVVRARCRVAYGSRVCGRSQPPHAKRCVLALCARGLVH